MVAQDKTVTVRLTQDEHADLCEAAAEQGETPAEYLRSVAQSRGLAAAEREAEVRRLGVLIDADNAQASLLGAMLAETAKHGAVVMRRAYGDWSTPRLAHWRPLIRKHALHAVQQFPNVSGKNITDIALVIDAMDLLHTSGLGGLCIVSSDSDFTPLATRIREHGLFAMGIGRRDTPEAFAAACDIFVHTEDLLQTDASASSDSDSAPAVEVPWTEMVADATRVVQREDGWALLSRVGDLLQERSPDFDPRSYGVAGGRLLALVQQEPGLFEVALTSPGGQHKIRVLADDTRVQPASRAESAAA